MEDTLTVKQALNDFYKQNYFGTEVYTDKIFWVYYGPFKVPFPNPKKRREVIHLHDVTHLMTGYDTSWTGEGEIAAWELASGFPKKYWIGWLYSPLTFTVGMFISPLRVIKAFRRGWKSANLYKIDIPKEELNVMTLATLKRRLQQS
jgi:hypothetical protein